MKFINLVGQKFGKLTVMERVENINKRKSKPHGCVAYLCNCECGTKNVIVAAQELKKGDTKSCGCIKSRLKLNDLTGKKFGKLTVVARTENVNKSQSRSRGQVAYLCNCECGKENVIAQSNLLKNGHTKSCGCLNLEYEDLVGTIFGKLIVRERTENLNKGQSQPHGYVAFKCDCECGSTNIIVEAGALKNGGTQSCGCSATINESIVGKFMDFHKIIFKKHQHLKKININFPDLFVDYLVENSIIIEYNGKQHYKPVRFGGISHEKAQLKFNKQVNRDKKLEQFCKENGYKLIIIDGEQYKGKKLEKYLEEYLILKIKKLAGCDK